MPFVEPTFLFVFLPAMILLCAPFKARAANIMLLCGSVFFYIIGDGYYVLVILACAAANYVVGLIIDKSRMAAKPALAAGVIFNLGLLFFFKYSFFFISNATAALGLRADSFINASAIHMPLGISFFTLQAVTYIVDIYNGKAKAQRNPLTSTLYMTMFTQVLSGPIVKYREIADQFDSRRADRSGVSLGATRFVIGLGKKMIIADTLAACADNVFSVPADQLTVSLAWLGAVCYTLQIYFDFSGYSDMAIGTGHMFGFRLPENFNYPYCSRSLREFWHRWHISLSTWFRDYLYIPVGGNRGSKLRTYANLISVFVLCGLWHGAEWKYLAWGLYHGVFLILERMGLAKVLDRIPRAARHAYTLLVVSTGWVFFRAATLSGACSYIAAMFGFAGGDGVRYHASLYLQNDVALALIAGTIGAIPSMPAAIGFIKRAASNLSGTSHVLFDAGMATARIVALILVFSISAMLVASGTYAPFLYAKF